MAQVFSSKDKNPGERKMLNLYSNSDSINDNYLLKIHNLHDKIFKIQNVIDSLDDGYWEWNLETNQISFSPKYYTMLGYNPGEFPESYEGWKQIIHPEDLCGADKLFQETIQNKRKSFYSEFRLRGKSNEWHWILAHCITIESDHEGNPTKLLITSTDITTRKNIVKSILNSEITFWSVWKNSFDGMRLNDENGNTILVNDAFCRMVEKTNSDLIGKPFTIIYQPDSQEESLKKQIKKISSRSVEPYLEKEVILWNGKKKWFELSNSFIELEDKKILLLSIFRDITDKKQVEIQLIESEEKYRTLVENAEDIIILSDLEFRPIFRNKAFFNSLGYDPLIDKNLNLLNLIHEDDIQQIKNSFKMLLSAGTFTGEYRARNKEGNYIFYHYKSVLVNDRDRKPKFILSVVRDITDFKIIEEKILKSEENARAIINAPSDIALLVKRNGEIILANETAASRLNLKKDDAIGKNLFDLFPEHISISRKREINKILESGKSGVFEDERDGIFYEVHVYPIPDKMNRIDRYAININDITYRKKSQLLLIENEERYRIASELTGQIVYDWDVLSGKIYWTGAIEKITGFTFEEFQGIDLNRWIELIHPEDKNYAVELLNRSMTESGKYFIEYRFMRKDGKYIIIKESGVFIKNDKNENIRMIGTMKDISERKKSEEILRKSEERYRNLAESLPDMIYIINLDGKITYINSKVEIILGVKSENLVGKNFGSLISFKNISNLLESIKNNQESNEFYLGEEKISIQNGDLWVDLRFVPLHDEKGNLNELLIVMRNITQIKKAETERLRLQNLETLGILAGGIAHDFNNILGAILGRVDLALYNLPDGNMKNNLLSIEKATKRAVGLTRQLLTFAKGGKPEKCTISIRKIIQDTAKFSLSGSNVDARFNFKDKFAVEADPGQISQVIQNLVINAKQAMPNGGVIEISTEDIIENNRVYARITIKDSGIGIPNENLEKIFDPYFTTKETGSGLGLSVCYTVVKKHDGLITVNSIQGEGTTFTITLPAVLEKTTVQNEGKNIVTDKYKCLIMDDEDEIRDVFQSMLISLGHSVIVSRDGDEAIRLFDEALNKNEPFQMVFLDLTIKGGMGGRDTVRIIKQRNTNAKLIVCSGYSDTAIANYLNDGFHEKLIKPYTIHDLNEVIFNVMKTK